MIEVKQIAQFNPEDLARLVTGYASDAKYLPTKIETEDRMTITLELVLLERPYIKSYAQPDAETLEHYGRLVRDGFSFAAYKKDECVGITLAEARRWHRSVQVCEFHIAAGHRRQGLGRALMEAIIEQALAAGMRAVLCVSQSTNVPAIRFYRRMGFGVEGIDLSYYTNEDYPDGEVALFLKKRLA